MNSKVHQFTNKYISYILEKDVFIKDPLKSNLKSIIKTIQTIKSFIRHKHKEPITFNLLGRGIRNLKPCHRREGANVSIRRTTLPVS